MTKKVKKVTEVAEVVEVIDARYDVSELSTLAGKSSKIRYLTSKGLTRSEISKLLNIRYQHVRNVQVTLLKKDMK